MVVTAGANPTGLTCAVLQRDACGTVRSDPSIPLRHSPLDLQRGKSDAPDINVTLPPMLPGRGMCGRAARTTEAAESARAATVAKELRHQLEEAETDDEVGRCKDQGERGLAMNLLLIPHTQHCGKSGLYTNMHRLLDLVIEK